MILITGGPGPVGSHPPPAPPGRGGPAGAAPLPGPAGRGGVGAAQQHRAARRPDFLADELGRRAAVERLDVGDGAAVLELGRRYPISAVVHLAATGTDPADPVGYLRDNTLGLLNVLRAA